LSAGASLLEQLVDALRCLPGVGQKSAQRMAYQLLERNREGGQRLSQALAEFPEVFSKVFVSLVRSGEQTGRLPEVLKSLSESLKWEDELAEQTKKLMMYPVIVGAIVLLVTLFLMVYLVPQMVGFIRNMGQQIPWYTEALIFVSSIFVNFWWAILALPFAAWFGLKWAMRVNPAVEYAVDRYKISMPVLGPILRKIVLSRFASSFGMMYGSGITVLDAIRSCEEIVGNRVLEVALRSVGQQIADGKNMTAAFQDAGLFPPLVIRMLKIGENTGKLDTALLNVTYFYNREVRDSVGRAQAALQPALTLLLGLVLLWVMLAVLGPVYDTISKMKF